MVDWNSLEGLKKKSDTLSVVILGLCLFLFVLPSHIVSGSKNTKDIHIEAEERARVSSISGARMRAEPNIESEIITTIPVDKEIVIISRLGYPANINGEDGLWYNVKYLEWKGYVWNKNLFESNNSDK